MKKLLTTVFVTTLCCLGVVFSGCGGFDLYLYMYVNAYEKINNTELTDSVVRELKVDWLVGQVNVISTDVESITLKETGENATKKPAYYKLGEDGILDIRYYKSGEIRDLSIIKNLTVEVPRGFNFVNVEVKAHNANVSFNGIRSVDMSIEHDNSDSTINSCVFETAEVSTGSGNCIINSTDVVSILTLKPETGTMSVTGGNIKDYRVSAYKGEVTLNMPDESFSLYLRDYGTCDYSDFEGVVVEGDQYTYGDVLDIKHTVVFVSSHTAAQLNLKKSVV